MSTNNLAEQLDALAGDIGDAATVLSVDADSSAFKEAARSLAITTLGYVRLGMMRLALHIKRESEDETNE